MTIRGTHDNETIIIDGPLGLIGDTATGKQLTIVGRGGKDIIKINGLDKPGDYYHKVSVDGGALSEGNELFINDIGSTTNNVYDVTGAYVTRRGLSPVTFVGISKLDVTTGTGQNHVVFARVPQALAVAVTAAASTQDRAEVQGDYLNDPKLVGFEHLELHGGRLKLDTHPMTVDTYRQTGGTLDGKANLKAGKQLSWTGGAMEGTGLTVAEAGSLLTITGPDPKALVGRTLQNDGTGTWTGGPITGGTGAIDNTSAATFAAAGTFAGTFLNDGLLLPGDDGVPGLLAVGGPFRHGYFYYSSSARLRFDLGSPGAGSDRMAAGSVALSGGFDPHAIAGFPADRYTVIANTGPAPVDGTFAGLPEAAVLAVGGERYRITYAGGDGNDVVLKRLFTIGDRVWYDFRRSYEGSLPDPLPTGDGVQNDAEDFDEAGGFHGLVVRLLDEGGQAVATTTTGLNGEYVFQDVDAGKYKVQFVLPPDYDSPTHHERYRFARKDALGTGVPDSELDSDADAGGLTDWVAVGPGGVATNVDAGVVNVWSSASPEGAYRFALGRGERASVSAGRNAGAKAYAVPDETRPDAVAAPAPGPAVAAGSKPVPIITLDAPVPSASEARGPGWIQPAGLPNHRPWRAVSLTFPARLTPWPDPVGEHDWAALWVG